MITAKELYTNAKQSTEVNVSKALTAITDELLVASNSGQFDYEILLYKYPILKKVENIELIVTELKSLGFDIKANLNVRYPSLWSLTVSWEK